MQILMWGSRSLTWKHLPVLRALAVHATLGDSPLLTTRTMSGLLAGVRHPNQPMPETFTLINGDGPPGKQRGAVGADKLALLACMEAWPEDARRVRWFKPEDLQAKQPGLSWAQAAAMRDVAMADARPDRSYCIHTDLDASRGSIITARALTERGLPYWYVRVSPAGAVLSVEVRTP